ncbi:MAG: PqqD family protein [Candidatus Aenigmarchaeota archaeon]|jgi:aminopeptidase-like protein|nr:PqqD family protein [Candidatus Aenigmarchaeota archaeon]
MEEWVMKRPKKIENLKIIEHVGGLYATFDGERYWRIEKWAFEILKLCDGRKSISEIARILAEELQMNWEDVLKGLKPIIEEFERVGFIKYV